MMKQLQLTILILLAGILLSGCSREPAAKPAIEGQPAPLFSLKDMEGNEVKLDDLQGKVVMVNFWATWCPPCREEIPSMVRLNSAMAGKPFQMLAISIDEGGKETVAKFFANAKARLPVLLDSDKKVGSRYGITGVPETFIIDRKGVILKKIIGPLDWSDPQVLKFLEEAGKN